MRRIKLGHSDLDISIMGLGCMGMSDFYGENADWSQRPKSEGESVATIRHALDLGVNFIDTADIYGNGHNEELVGRAVAQHLAGGGRREDFVVCTKFGNVRAEDGSWQGVSGKPDYIRMAAERSLRYLNLEHIDLYYQHRIDPNTPIEETVGALKELVTAGKVRYIGLSEASVATLRKANAVHPISALQTEFSLWTRDPEAEHFAACAELGITFVAYSPLGRGFLAGAFKSEADLLATDSRRTHPRFQGENFQHNLQIVTELERTAEAHGCTTAQAALAWVLANSKSNGQSAAADSVRPDVVPIPGTKRRERLEENAKAAAIQLSEGELARLSEVAPPGWTAGTRYAERGMAGLNR